MANAWDIAPDREREIERFCAYLRSTGRLEKTIMLYDHVVRSFLTWSGGRALTQSTMNDWTSALQAKDEPSWKIRARSTAVRRWLSFRKETGPVPDTALDERSSSTGHPTKHMAEAPCLEAEDRDVS